MENLDTPHAPPAPPAPAPDGAPPWAAIVWARLNAGEFRMDQMQAELRANTVITSEVKGLLDEGKAGLRVLGHLGSAAKWLTAMAAALTAIATGLYYVTHPGSIPPPK